MRRDITENTHNDDAQLVLFKGHAIRQEIHKGEWHFSIVDIMEAVAGTDRPRQYWEDLKTQLIEKEWFSDQLSEKIVQLKMTARDGKKRLTDAATIETVLRIVQSIPSKQAEPFKRWLARLGYERLKEINDPELAIKRTMFFYAAKGYEEKWITERIKTITSRNGNNEVFRGKSMAFSAIRSPRKPLGCGFKTIRNTSGWKNTTTYVTICHRWNSR